MSANGLYGGEWAGGSYAPGMSSQQEPPPYGPQPPRKVKSVTKHRGLSAGAHGRHLLLTVCTCGLWLPVWFCMWMYRLFVRRREVTRYRVR